MKNISRKKLLALGFGLWALGFGLWALSVKINEAGSVKSFHFSDYHRGEDLYAALIKLFPIGTPRENVEKILVDHAKLGMGGKRIDPDRYFITYFDPHKDAGLHFEFPYLVGLREARFEYNKANLVQSIDVQILTGKSSIKFFPGNTIQKGEVP